MRRVITTLVAAALLGLPLRAADDISGTWTTAAGGQTAIFKVRGDAFTGLICGPCDDPAHVFRIESGRIIDAQHVSFAIVYDVAGPLFDTYGAYRAQVTATLAGTELTLSARREGADEPPVVTTLRRVVENGRIASPGPALVATRPLTPLPPTSPIDGKWVAAGRVTQQNFVLKVRDNRIWGLVCGPCNPEGVFLIDDGSVDGDAVTFYINHIDTPPSPARHGLNRNIMRGMLTGNVMKFKWVREGAENEPGGEMVLIGPLR